MVRFPGRIDKVLWFSFFLILCSFQQCCADFAYVWNCRSHNRDYLHVLHFYHKGLEDNESIWDLSMTQFYLPDNIVIPKSEFKTIPLSLADAERLYEKDKLVAWGMT